MMRGRTSTENRRQQGSILVTAMILLLVMSLMGIGLIQSSVKSSETAASKTIDAEVFHITESCNQEALEWLRAQTRPPDNSNLPYTITRDDLSHLETGAETAEMLGRLTGYSYTCTINQLANQSVLGDTTGEGQDIGIPGGYGDSGDISPRFYYRIDATGSGPQNARKRIISLVSLEF